MATLKQRKARARNYNKFRLKGFQGSLKNMSVSVIDNCLTKHERSVCKRLSGEISELLRMWRSKI